jgi:predicted DsbA family dithiol-disulfide isomerase
MHIEAWSDIACPFCYIGKRHLEIALADFKHKNEVTLEWKSFELQPDADQNPDGSLRLDAMLAAKLGVSEKEASTMNQRVVAMAKEAGLEYHLDTVIPTNTFTAHRFLHLAKQHGLQDKAKERLMAAYFTEGKHVGSTQTLAELMLEVGLELPEIEEVLAGEDYGYNVRTDEQEARSLGISGVPFFVFDRKLAISGAQPVELFKEVLEKTWAEAHPLTVVGGDDSVVCEDDSCSVPKQ